MNRKIKGISKTTFFFLMQTYLMSMSVSWRPTSFYVFTRKVELINMPVLYKHKLLWQQLYYFLWLWRCECIFCSNINLFNIECQLFPLVLQTEYFPPDIGTVIILDQKKKKALVQVRKQILSTWQNKPLFFVLFFSLESIWSNCVYFFESWIYWAARFITSSFTMTQSQDSGYQSLTHVDAISISLSALLRSSTSWSLLQVEGFLPGFWSTT